MEEAEEVPDYARLSSKNMSRGALFCTVFKFSLSFLTSDF